MRVDATSPVPTDSAEQPNLFEILLRGEFNITGLRNKNLRSRLAEFSSAQISRLIKRLRIHGLIKKVGRSYKYYLTALGKRVLIAGLRLKEMFLVPTLAAA